MGRELGFFSGDDGSAREADLFDPYGVTFDREGNLYIPDRYNNRVRRVDKNGTITTIAGNGGRSLSAFIHIGDGGPAREAILNWPHGLAVDPSGHYLFISEFGGHRIRRMDLQTGIVVTVAGQGRPGYAGDGGPARQASLNTPTEIEFDAAANLYIADMGNHAIRKITRLLGER